MFSHIPAHEAGQICPQGRKMSASSGGPTHEAPDEDSDTRKRTQIPISSRRVGSYSPRYSKTQALALSSQPSGLSDGSTEATDAENASSVR